MVSGEIQIPWNCTALCVFDNSARADSDLVLSRHFFCLKPRYEYRRFVCADARADRPAEDDAADRDAADGTPDIVTDTVATGAPELPPMPPPARRRCRAWTKRRALLCYETMSAS